MVIIVDVDEEGLHLKMIGNNTMHHQGTYQNYKTMMEDIDTILDVYLTAMCRR